MRPRIRDCYLPDSYPDLTSSIMPESLDTTATPQQSSKLSHDETFSYEVNCPA